MKKRSIEIIQDLLYHRQNTTIQVLNREYGISQKSVRNDIKDINQFLLKIGLSPISILKDGSLKLKADFDESIIMESIYNLDLYDYKATPEERRQYILVSLLLAEDYITTQSLADELFVTRNTVSKDIDEIRKEICHISITIMHDAGKGICINGAYEQIFESLILVCKQIKLNTKGAGTFQRIILRKMNVKYPLEDIFTIAQEYVYINKLLFEEAKFYMITLSLFIIFNFPPERSKEMIDISDTNLSKNAQFYLYLTRKLNVNPDKNSLSIFMKFIQINELNSFVKTIDEIELFERISYFLTMLEPSIHVNLVQDSVLTDALFTHIKSLKNWGEIHVELPYEDENNINYKYIRELVDNNSYILESLLGYMLSENMKNSIVIHICVAIIRNRDMCKISVAVICPGGRATGKYLAAQVQNYFDVEVSGNYSVNELLSKIKNANFKTDFILSTVKLHIPGYKVIYVNPFLNMDDLNNIQSEIFLKRDIYVHSVDSKQTQIKDYIRRVIQDNALAERLCKGIEDITLEYKNESIANTNTKRVFTKLLTEHDIEITNQIVQWETAIYRSSANLIQRNCIETSYIEAAIENIKKYGAYMISPGVAFIHAAKDAGVYKDGLSLLICRKGTEFPNCGKVYLVFCFSSRGEQEYLDLIRTIVMIGRYPKRIKKIIFMKDKTQIFNYLVSADWNIKKINQEHREEV